MRTGAALFSLCFLGAVAVFAKGSLELSGEDIPAAVVAPQICSAPLDIPVSVPVTSSDGQPGNWGSNRGMVEVSGTAVRECRELRNYEKRVCHDELRKVLRTQPSRAQAKFDECEINFLQRRELCRLTLSRTKAALELYLSWMKQYAQCDHLLSPRLPPTRANIARADADFAAADEAEERDRILAQTSILNSGVNPEVVPTEAAPSEPFTDGPPEI